MARSRKLTPQEKAALKRVRHYTGDHFTPANGYSAAKLLNFGQRMAIARYDRKIAELTSRPVVEYRPKRGEKAEAFEYTGQKGFRFFNIALVHKPDVDAQLDFTIDRSRPRGSRFVPVNKQTGQRYYHIPARPFLGPEYLDKDFINWLEDQEIDPFELEETELHELVLEFYSDDAEFYLIQAGESYMWGAGGGKDAVAEKISTILNNYGSTLFNANDKNSSYYGNWFRGVTGFTNRFDAIPMISEAQRKKRERIEKYKLSNADVKWRELSDGSFGRFEGNRFTGERIWPKNNRR